MRLFLVRHGQTPANVIESMDTGIPGPGLTARGHLQAEALVDQFRDVEIGGMWASTLVRTQLTGAPLAADRGIRPTILDGLREVDAGELERHTDLESHQIYHDVVTAWLYGDLDRRMPGAISGHEFLARFDASIAEVVASGVDNAVVVSHGTAIRHWAGIRVAGVEPEFIEHNFLPNTGVVEIEGEPGAWSLVSWMQRSGHRAGETVDGSDAPDETGEMDAVASDGAVNGVSGSTPQ